MRYLFELITPWLIVIVLSIPALWVFYDMLRDTLKELRDRWGTRS
jgi:hypothetical protein